MKLFWLGILISATAFGLAGCSEPDASKAVEGLATTELNQAKPIKLAVFRFQHETCTFCPGGDVTIADWTKIRAPDQGDKVLTRGRYVRGFTAAANEYEDVELVGLSSPTGVFGGSSRSFSTTKTFDHFVNQALQEAEAAQPDGIYLALHGAMAVRDIPRPEAEIARRFRERLGPDIPIVATFDLHGNEDEQFLQNADMSFVTKRYPHYDAGLQGARAARSLVRLVKGTYVATTTTRKPAIITPTVLQWTGKSPNMDIMERARRWEAREVDAYVSVFFGFPWADVPDVGHTIQVMTNNDQALADKIADDMQDFMLRKKEALYGQTFLQPSAAANQAKQLITEGEWPVVLADYSDRSGDATFILSEIVSQELSDTLYGTLRDEHALQRIMSEELEAGDAFNMAIGGFAGPASGEPSQIQGTIGYLGKGAGFDQIAVINFGDNNSVIITPALKQITTLSQLRSAGVEPDDYKVFVTKSRVHFRRGFDETGYAKSILLVDAPGSYVGTVRLDALDYQNVELSHYYPYQMRAK